MKDDALMMIVACVVGIYAIDAIIKALNDAGNAAGNSVNNAMDTLNTAVGNGVDAVGSALDSINPFSDKNSAAVMNGDPSTALFNWMNQTGTGTPPN